ncbi:hypothetical protein [Azospirillum melinis]
MMENHHGVLQILSCLTAIRPAGALTGPCAMVNASLANQEQKRPGGSAMTDSEP